jgi:hypothetical protein
MFFGNQTSMISIVLEYYKLHSQIPKNDVIDYKRYERELYDLVYGHCIGKSFG